MFFVLFDTMARRNSIATNYKSMNEHEDIREVTGVCDTIQSLTIDSAPESTGVTTFVQEACTAVSAVDSTFSKTLFPVQEDLQYVKDYFKRPVCITAGVVPSVRSRAYLLTSTFRNLLGFWDNGVNRLEGAYGIRAKVVLTLQVAATPFHQGALCLSVQYGLAKPNFGVYDRAIDSCTATNLPHVVLDLSNDTSVQLHVPFLYVAEYCVIGTSTETVYASFSLNNLASTPTVSGMAAPTYQIYMHLEDIELFGATPQNTTTVTVNAGRKLSPVTEEFEQDSHPFSSALHAASRSISFLAKGVPSLSSIGGPVSWALGKAAGVVRYFGYGKPAITDPVMRIFRQDNVGEFNTDVATGCMVLAATAANTTSINTTVGASDVDEMALSYITSRWGQLNVFDFTTSANVGTLLYVCPINMLALWFRAPTALPAGNRVVPQISTATTNSVQPTHLMYAASCFKQWRGGLKFRFTFVKTKMHAGRVMVNFNPFYTTASNTTTMTSATSVPIAAYGTLGADPFGYSAVFDLRDGNVFEFKVPFVCPTPYAALASYTGALSMYVVNNLIASTVVSSTISVIVQVCGDTDFELANPVGPMFSPHNLGTIRLNSGRVLSETPEEMNQLTMGESITSVKQLIGIPSTFWTQLALAPTSVLLPPWFYQPTPSTATPPVGGPPLRSFTYGGYWASAYSFLKGGTDFHFYSDDSSAILSLFQNPNPGGLKALNATPDNRALGNAPMLFTARGALHARLPGFFPTARVNSYAANFLTAAGSTWGGNPYTPAYEVGPYAGLQALYALSVTPLNNTSRLQYNRNASDDAQLAQYIGPPPIFLPAAVAAGDYDVQGGAPFSFT